MIKKIKPTGPMIQQMNTISPREIGDSLMGNKRKPAQKTNISKKIHA